MSRIRTVKPELFRHEALFEAEQVYQLPLRLAFTGLFTCCDREGRFRWRPRQLKLDVLPYDEVDFSRVLDALATRGFLVKYEVNGEIYGCIPSWNKHQAINNKESASFLPSIKDGVFISVLLEEHEEKNINKNNELVTREARVLHAPSTRSQSALESLKYSQGEKEGEKEGNIKKEKQAKEKSFLADDFVCGENYNVVDDDNCADNLSQSTSSANLHDSESLQNSKPKNLQLKNSIEQLFQFWQATLNHPNAKLDKKRQACIRQALALGFSVEQLQSAIVGCSKTPHNLGHNDRGERYDGLHVIFKNADNIERFIRNCHNPPQQSLSIQENKNSILATKQTRFIDGNFENKQYTQTPLADITWLKADE